MKAWLAAGLLCLATASSARTKSKSLSRAEAERRASLISEPEYDLALTLDGEAAEFSGQETVRFALASADDDLTLDFVGGTIATMTVNGAPAAPPAAGGSFFVLPKELLRAGVNVVELSYSHPYSADGAGLYRVKDPEDGRVYAFTDFEPYDAHRLFPCFDQPDLKAAIALTVEAPPEWTVVSASPEEKIENLAARRRWTFGRTPRLSTYVFSVAAGPFHVWTSTAGPVPLRLFARESLAAYVAADDWFALTRRGLGFYAAYFDRAYPFEKYDSLIVPDLNEEGMENAGAATFSEAYVFRSTPTVAAREERDATILHELAHMWFGDLVTMRWWNDLWLNESFATYLALAAQTRAADEPGAAESFLADEERAAYEADERATTHPIETGAADTDQAFASFDAITYGKGAAALKQLAYVLGEERFRAGVRRYVKSSAYGSATARDFFAAMSSATGVDLEDWRRDWLETAGADSVRADAACGADGRIASFALAQTAPADRPVLRRHRTEIALFGERADGSWEAQEPVAAGYAGPRTEVPALIGRPCPVLIYPNSGDRDYAKAELDGRSLAAAATGLERISDPLLRALLWNSLWEMVRDAKWPADAYAGLVLSRLGAETDFETASAVLETVAGRDNAAPSVLSYLEKPDYPRFEEFFLKNLAAARPGGDFQRLWFDGYARAAASAEGARRLRGYLSGEVRTEGLVLDADRRWRLVARLSELGAPDAEALIAAEAARDPSDRGVKAAIAARASRPDAAQKSAWFARIADPKSEAPLAELRAAMSGLFPRTQRELRARFVAPFYRSLPELAASKSEDYLYDYARAMIPALCAPESVAAEDAFLEKNPSLKPVVLRALRDARQEDERCVKIRALSARTRRGIP